MASLGASRPSMGGEAERDTKSPKTRLSLSASFRKSLHRGLSIESSRQPKASSPTSNDGDEEGDAPIEPAATVLSAWMVKCGGRTKTWKRRWFVLDADNLLTYYKSELARADDFMGFIDLNTARRVVLQETNPSASHKHCFAVETDGRSWVISASSDNERTKWVDMLTELLPPQEDINVDLEGVLWKTGRVNKAWRKRHFCLTGRYVAYFKQKSDLSKFKSTISSSPDKFYEHLEASAGYIPLSEAKLEDTGSFNGRDHCISVKVPGRVYRVSAASRQEATLWMRAMRQRTVSGRPSTVQGRRLSAAVMDTVFGANYVNADIKDGDAADKDSDHNDQDDDAPTAKSESESDSDHEEAPDEETPIL